MYDYATPFCNGLAFVENNKRNALIDKSSKTVLDFGTSISLLLVISDNYIFAENQSGLQVYENPLNIIKVIVNGKLIAFDQPPIIENGRTLVPLRSIFEAMGATVEWNQDTKTIVATRSGKKISLIVGNSTATIDGKTLSLDVSPKMINGRTMVPVRFIGESFNAVVSWDNDNRTVNIKMN